MTNNNTQELLPCPFCGKQPTIEERDLGHKTYWLIACKADIGLDGTVKGCAVSRSANLKSDAIEKWNNRHSTPKPEPINRQESKEILEKLNILLTHENINLYFDLGNYKGVFLDGVIKDCKAFIENVQEGK